MSDTSSPSDDWRAASASGSNGGQCVEAHRTLFRIRDSKNPGGGELTGKIPALVAAVKAGQIGR